MSSCSFANATSEPENEMLPISAESRIATDSSASSSPGSGARLWNSASAISADRAAADAVEERHHLRHRGHLHRARADDARSTAPIAIASAIQP